MTWSHHNILFKVTFSQTHWGKNNKQDFFLLLLFSQSTKYQLPWIVSVCFQSEWNCSLYMLYNNLNVFVLHCPVDYSHALQQKETMKQEFVFCNLILSLLALSFPRHFPVFLETQTCCFCRRGQTDSLKRAAFVSETSSQKKKKNPHELQTHTHTHTYLKVDPDATCPTQVV